MFYPLFLIRPFFADLHPATIIVQEAERLFCVDGLRGWMCGVTSTLAKVSLLGRTPWSAESRTSYRGCRRRSTNLEEAEMAKLGVRPPTNYGLKPVRIYFLRGQAGGGMLCLSLLSLLVCVV